MVPSLVPRGQVARLVKNWIQVSESRARRGSMHSEVHGKGFDMGELAASAASVAVDEVNGSSWRANLGVMIRPDVAQKCNCPEDREDGDQHGQSLGR